MENRAEAEKLRLAYFTEITNQADNNNSIEALWYTKRYLVDMQVSYYAGRSDELEKKSNKALVLIAILAGIVAILNGTVGLFSNNYGIEFTSFAALAIIVQAYSFVISNRELNDQNIRNAERYSRTRSVLNSLASKINKVEKNIASGNTEALKKYIVAVNEVISTEHRQWLINMESSSHAINELEEELSKIKTNNELQDE